LQLSFSKLRTYNECALKYRFAYVERLPRPPLKSLQFQRKLHGALAFYHRFARRDGIVRVEELLKAYEEIWEVDRNPDTKDTKAFKEGEEILRAYCERENSKGRVVAYTEHKLSVPFGPYTLTGSIDRMDFTESGGYSLVDYKLDRELPSENLADSSRQLSFYHLLVWEGMGFAPDDGRLYYLRHGVEQVSRRTRQDLRETVDWLDQTTSHIREERKWLPCEGDACKSCPFWSYCPAKTGQPREHKPIWRQTSILEIPEVIPATRQSRSISS